MAHKELADFGSNELSAGRDTTGYWRRSLVYHLVSAADWTGIARCIGDAQIFDAIAPESYGFDFEPYLSGVDGIFPIG